ncbi:MAG TPA: diacylglycerol kinase family protein [Candidatus Xenobia bacterium]|nr:diacylglycerol kinase family protein [Candidatus Xenobia bacterium]
MAEPARFRRARLIYNPIAGWRRERREHELRRAVALLAASGLRAELVPTAGPGSATTLAGEAIGAGCDLIIVSGGDGTINEAVNGMVGTRVPLAVLPAGTGNALARELELPLDPWRAAEYIPRGVVRRIALGRALGQAGRRQASSGQAGSRYFIATAGAGADANIIHRLSTRTKLRWGMLSYWFEGLRQWAQYDFREFDVEVNGETLTATLLVVGRAQNYGGPVQITRGADLLGDDFEVAVFPRRPRVFYLLYLAAQFVGLLERCPRVRFLRTRKLVARPRDARVHVHADGELIGELPMEFEIVPDALSLLLPRALADARRIEI